MKTIQATKIISKAREEFHKIEIQSREAERRLNAAQEMNKQAKLKFKHIKKWARQAKKLARNAKAEAAEKEDALQKAAIWLTKLEKKALRKIRPKARTIKAASTKPIKKVLVKKVIATQKKKNARPGAKIFLAHVSPPETQPEPNVAEKALFATGMPLAGKPNREMI